MPLCIRCKKGVSYRGEFLGWELITKEGVIRVTLQDVHAHGGTLAFFDNPQDMIIVDDHFIGLCPDCQIRKTYVANLVKRIEPTIEATNLDELIEICEKCYPDFKYEGHKIISDNTS
jgi:hypothetical protein